MGGTFARLAASPLRSRVVIPNQVILIAGIIGAVVVLIVGLLVMVAKFWRQVDQGTALIVNKMGNEPLVTFTGMVVLPVVNRAETMDIWFLASNSVLGNSCIAVTNQP